ncbi:MAG TPA: hypothetical protein VGS19_28345 [Streptosporangiaceae bacterium]|nr:hypothetical protein [Streptosporangiaceae bacterium]
METFRLQRRYQRTDPAGRCPSLLGYPSIELNRLALFWRQLIDLNEAPFTQLRFQALPLVVSWLADPGAAEEPWFAILSVPGLRNQVLRHAGLDDYICAEPSEVPTGLRTPRWQTLVDHVAGFEDLDVARRSLVVLALNQLTLGPCAVRLAGRIQVSHDPASQTYAYEVARALGRNLPTSAGALNVYRWLATSAVDPMRAIAACAQGLTYHIRGARDMAAARPFMIRGLELLGTVSARQDWQVNLLRSRMHRAIALLHFRDSDAAATQAALRATVEASDSLCADSKCDSDSVVALLAREDRKIVVESQIKAAVVQPEDRAAEIEDRCAELAQIDPYCVDTKLTIGDAYAAIGKLDGAAVWYSRAGELGTGAGATGWFRAGQCYDRLGDKAAACTAMGRCLELDGTAIEPASYLAEAS